MADPIRQDPTQTGGIRRRFMADMNRRVASLIRAIIEFMVTQDALGLKPGVDPLSFNQNKPLNLNQVEKEVFKFRTDAGKIEAFRDWFQEQLDLGILEIDPITGDPWTAQYVDSAYRKGAVRAFTDTRRELQEEAGFIRGRQAEFLTSSFAAPETVQKIRAISTRTFEELKGISAQMSQQVARNLADGLSQGLGPRQIARNMSNSITGINRQRALVLARTEVVRAHAEGQLDAFEDLNVEELGIMQEFTTAGDDRVCPRCAVLEGTVFTVKEARGIIPRHPNCRCAFIPAGVGEVVTRPRATTKTQVQARVDASIKAELPQSAESKTLRAAKARTTNPIRDLKVGTRTQAQRRRLGPGSSVIPRPPGPTREERRLERERKELEKLRTENRRKKKELEATRRRTAKLRRDLEKVQEKEKEDKEREDSLRRRIKETRDKIKETRADIRRIDRQLKKEDEESETP